MYPKNTPDRKQLLIHRNRTYIREFLAKPFLLAAVITIAIAAVLSIIVSLVQFGAGVAVIIEQVNEVIKENSTDGPGLSVSSRFEFPLENLLLIGALLAMYFSSRKGKKESAPTGAVTIFFVWSVITMIGDFASALTYIAAPALFALVLTVIAKAGHVDIGAQLGIDAMPDRVKAVAALVFIAVFAIHAILYIIRGISRFRFGSSLRKSVTTENLTAKGCTGYAASNIILSVLLISAAVLSAFGLMMFDKMDIPNTIPWMKTLKELPLGLLSVCGLISSLLSCVLPILLSVFALKYKQHILAAGENGCNLPEPANPAPAEITPATHTTESFEGTEDTEVAEASSAQDECEKEAEAPAAATEETFKDCVFPDDDKTTSAEEDLDNENPYADFLTQAPPETPVTPVPDTEKNVAPVKTETQTPQPKFCYVCGQPINPDQTFCAYCGAKLK